MKNILQIIKRRYFAFTKKDLPIYCSKSRKLSVIYYLLFDNSFEREIQSVLTGRVKYNKEAGHLKANYFLVIRNIHRIEKGLLMQPRRNVFGKEYINETIDNFIQIWRQKNSELDTNKQLKWFHDVLATYFNEIGGEDSEIKQLKNKFIGALAEKKIENGSTKLSIPYKRIGQDKSKIMYDEFYKLCKQRRSVRWYLNKPVDRELIDRAILAANQSPSACNRQPFEFRVFDDAKLVQQVVKFPYGTAGYGHNIPVLIVIVGNLDAYSLERDRHVVYIDASLAAMSLMLALETMNLSSCAINWPDIEYNEIMMANFLKLENYQRPIMCLSLGYPDDEGLVAFSEKRPIQLIRSYNAV